MDPIELTADSFWQSDHCLMMVNPRDTAACDEAEIIRPWAGEQSGLKGHLLFATSGSTGVGKWVALSKAALLASARMVNKHLMADETDRWLCSLPEFHVGGMGILARCYQAGSSVVQTSGRWDAQMFHAKLGLDEITLTSLVPTQLVDLVQCRLSAPPSLRTVLIGGGRLEDQVYKKAIELGWPIMETYGMTEACSQVATATLGSRDLAILPGWDVKTDHEGRLMIKGESLFTGYVSSDGGVVAFNDPKEKGWFATSDLVSIENKMMTVNGRADRCVKVLGELVNLAGIEQKLSNTGKVTSLFAVVAIPDHRSGCRLVLCVPPECNHDELLADYNKHCHPVERIDSVCVLENLPQSAMGKIRYAELTQMAGQSN